ncbi:Os03g0154800 [Oryza sativa Japonica Group]|uniref:Os03g0154800 protein n=1 Tax=Oryza sativa subsp. japonica TaxID=39947 RepID=A0A0P0VT39_ORYSJ|nr:Os03g0154800 [Oryza sativa Japonica Group]
MIHSLCILGRKEKRRQRPWDQCPRSKLWTLHSGVTPVLAMLLLPVRWRDETSCLDDPPSRSPRRRLPCAFAGSAVTMTAEDGVRWPSG